MNMEIINNSLSEVEQKREERLADAKHRYVAQLTMIRADRFSCRGLERDLKLAYCGYTREEVIKMTEPIKEDPDKYIQEIIRLQKEMLRQCAKENRRRKASGCI